MCTYIYIYIYARFACYMLLVFSLLLFVCIVCYACVMFMPFWSNPDSADLPLSAPAHLVSCSFARDAYAQSAY